MAGRDLRAYVSTNIVMAVRCTWEEFALTHGKTVGERGEDDGYLVVYPYGHENWYQRDEFERNHMLVSDPNLKTQ